MLRLLALALPDKFRWMDRQHGLAREGLMAWSTVGDVAELVRELGWEFVGEVPSRLKGPKGNQEYIVYMKKPAA